MDFPKRLRHALALRNKKPADLARALNISRASVSGWLTGDSKSMKAAHLLNAAQWLSVSAVWLESGKGPIELPARTPPPEATDDEPALLAAWRWLTRHERTEFLEAIQSRAMAYQAAAEERAMRVQARKLAHPAYSPTADKVLNAPAVPDEEVAKKLFRKGVPTKR